MIAVADASPVCYLVLIAEIELLPKLFTQVLLPREVLDDRWSKAPRRWSALGPMRRLRGSRFMMV
jgi:predicted nucleic acid-binding protein